MIRRVGRLEMGVRHARLQPIVLRTVFMAGLIVFWTVVGRRNPLAIIGVVAVAPIVLWASSRDYVLIEAQTLTVRLRTGGNMIAKVDVGDIAGVTMLQAGAYGIPAVLLNDGQALHLRPLSSPRSFGGHAATLQLAKQLATVTRADFITQAEFEERTTELRQLLSINADRPGRSIAFGVSIALLFVAAGLAATWYVGDEKLPRIATEGRGLASPAMLELESNSTHGIWGGPFIKAAEVVGPDGEGVEVEWVLWSEVYQRRTPNSAYEIGRFSTDRAGSYVVAVDFYDADEIVTIGVDQLPPILTDTDLLGSLGRALNDERFSVGQDPLNPDTERNIGFLYGAATCVLLSLVAGAVYVGMRANN